MSLHMYDPNLEPVFVSETTGDLYRVTGVVSFVHNTKRWKGCDLQGNTAGYAVATDWERDEDIIVCTNDKDSEVYVSVHDPRQAYHMTNWRVSRSRFVFKAKK